MDKRKSRLESPRSSISRSRSPLSNRSVSTSPRRGPSTPLQRENSDRELSTLTDDQKAILNKNSTTNSSDDDEIEEKKHSNHRHHRNHQKKTKRLVKRHKKEKKSKTRSPQSSDEESSTDQRRNHRKKRHSSSSNDEQMSQTSRSSSIVDDQKTTKGTQLIVNYLPSALRESDFYQLFARIAPIKLCKLITDRQTGHSHCYGFVEYHKKDDAAKAIEKFNGYKIEHKKLKVSYAQPKTSSNLVENLEPSPKTSNSSTKNPNLYITDLPDNVDERMLERLFSKHGEIVKTKVLRDPRTKISRGVAFVLMTSTRYAERAIKALDGFVPSGCRTPISVKFADRTKTNSGSNGNSISTSRMPNSPTVGPAIGPYGYPPGLTPFNIVDPYYAAAMHHHHHRRAMNLRDLSSSPPPPPPPFYPSASRTFTGSSRPRATSPGLPRSYSNSSSKSNSNLHQPMSSHMNSPSALAAACDLISKGCQQAIDPNGFVIYAFGLPHDCDENDLEDLFRRYGEIYRVYIVRNYTTGESKGYSFITMRNYNEACQAVSRLDGSTFQGRTIQVRFKQ